MSGSRHSDAWDSPGFLLWHATLRWQRAMAEALAPYVRALVAKDLLAREVDPDDARAWRVRPTAAGTDLARRAIAADETADTAYFDAVPQRSRAGMLAALRQLGGRRD